MMSKIILSLTALVSVSAFGTTYVPVQLLDPSGSTSGQAIVSAGPATSPAWSKVSATALAAQAANTVVANVTGSSASPTAFAMPSCSSSTSALQYTPGTGWTCYTSVASLTGATFSGAVSAPNGLSAGGTLTGFTGRLLNVRVFSATGTYTPTTGTAAVYVRVQGAGGAGGGTPVTNSSQAAAGSGGSAGSYAEGYYTSGYSGVTMTIGAGGTGSSSANGGAGGATSFGALLSCPGGAGGIVGSAAVSTFVTGAGGSTTACTGTSLMSRIGQAGSQSIVLAGPASRSGDGGSSTFGMSAGIWSTAIGFAGQFGGGGSGANAGISTAAQAGAAGGAGYIEVFEFSQ